MDRFGFLKRGAFHVTAKIVDKIPPGQTSIDLPMISGEVLEVTVRVFFFSITFYIT